MDMIKKIFPFSFKATDLTSLIIVLVIYAAVGLVSSFVIGVLGAIPIIKYLFIPVGSVIGLYVFAGIVLTLLDYFKVLK